MIKEMEGAKPETDWLGGLVLMGQKHQLKLTNGHRQEYSLLCTTSLTTCKMRTEPPSQSCTEFRAADVHLHSTKGLAQGELTPTRTVLYIS